MFCILFMFFSFYQEWLKKAVFTKLGSEYNTFYHTSTGQ